MSISSRFSVGIHILTLIQINKDGVNSSEYLANSINTNPAMVRRIMGMLKKANLVNVRPGVAGATLARSLSEITLFDIYKAVNVVKENELFSIHENPNPNCTVGKNIQGTITPIFISAQSSLENVLENVTLDHIVDDIIETEKLKAKD